jgi:hypothetical protein
VTSPDIDPDKPGRPQRSAENPCGLGNYQKEMPPKPLRQLPFVGQRTELEKDSQALVEPPVKSGVSRPEVKWNFSPSALRI